MPTAPNEEIPTVSPEDLARSLVAVDDHLPAGVEKELFGEPIFGVEPGHLDPADIQINLLRHLFDVFVGKINDGMRDENRPQIQCLYTIFGENVVAILEKARQERAKARKELQASRSGMTRFRIWLGSWEKKYPYTLDEIRQREAEVSFQNINKIIQSKRMELREALLASFRNDAEDKSPEVQVAIHYDKPINELWIHLHHARNLISDGAFWHQTFYRWLQNDLSAIEELMAYMRTLNQQYPAPFFAQLEELHSKIKNSLPLYSKDDESLPKGAIAQDAYVKEYTLGVNQFQGNATRLMFQCKKTREDYERRRLGDFLKAR